MDYNSIGARAYGLAEMISRLLGVENPGVLPVVAPEVTPSLDVGRLPPELMILAGRRPFAFSMTLPAVAAEAGYVGVLNPVDSGVVAVVWLMTTENPLGVAMLFNIRLNNTDPTRTLNAGIITTDTRWTGATSVHAIQGTEVAVSGANIGRFSAAPSVADNSIIVYPAPIVLGPGTNAIITAPNLNQAWSGGFMGYERSARPEELALT